METPIIRWSGAILLELRWYRIRSLLPIRIRSRWRRLSPIRRRINVYRVSSLLDFIHSIEHTYLFLFSCRKHVTTCSVSIEYQGPSSVVVQPEPDSLFALV